MLPQPGSVRIHACIPMFLSTVLTRTVRAETASSGPCIATRFCKSVCYWRDWWCYVSRIGLYRLAMPLRP